MSQEVHQEVHKETETIPQTVQEGGKTSWGDDLRTHTTYRNGSHDNKLQDQPLSTRPLLCNTSEILYN